MAEVKQVYGSIEGSFLMHLDQNDVHILQAAMEAWVNRNVDSPPTAPGAALLAKQGPVLLRRVKAAVEALTQEDYARRLRKEAEGRV